LSWSACSREEAKSFRIHVPFLILNSTRLFVLSFPAMFFLWGYILVPLLKAGLPQAGLAQTFPRDVLFRSTTVQGFGVFHPWYHQPPLLHLIALLEHTQQDMMTGQLITTSYEQLQLEMGTPGFMTNIPFKTMKATVANTWITDLWEFVDHFQIKIWDNIEQLRSQEKNNKFIVEEFIKAGCVGNELKQLNK
jgi:hypothetical protein